MQNQASHLQLTPNLLPFPSRTSDESRAVEAEFRSYYMKRMLPVARAGVGIGLLLVVMLSVIDLILMPTDYLEFALPLRAASMVLPLSAALLALFLCKERIWLPYFVATAAFMVGVAALALGAIAVHFGAKMSYWGAIFLTFNVYLVLGLNARQSMSVGWPVFVVYIGLGVALDAPIEKIGYGILFLGFSNLIGTYAGFLLERDAREIFSKNLELMRLARTDGLTGLFNRRTFDEHLRNAWKQARRDDKKIAVIVTDIDYFKLYNDCYGHQKGDDCIRVISDVLADSVSRPMDIVARYGGEEFVMVLYDPTPSFLESFTRNICHKVIDLDIDHKASEATPSVSVSVGASIADAASSMTADQLLRQADDALYEAKHQGRNQAIVYRSEWGQQTTANLIAALV